MECIQELRINFPFRVAHLLAPTHLRLVVMFKWHKSTWYNCLHYFLVTSNCLEGISVNEMTWRKEDVTVCVSDQCFISDYQKSKFRRNVSISSTHTSLSDFPQTVPLFLIAGFFLHILTDVSCLIDFTLVSPHRRLSELPENKENFLIWQS